MIAFLSEFVNSPNIKLLVANLNSTLHKQNPSLGLFQRGDLFRWISIQSKLRRSDCFNMCNAHNYRFSGQTDDQLKGALSQRWRFPKIFGSTNSTSLYGPMFIILQTIYHSKRGWKKMGFTGHAISSGRIANRSDTHGYRLAKLNSISLICVFKFHMPPRGGGI